MRLTEEQVEDRLMAAYHANSHPDAEQKAIDCFGMTVFRRARDWPDALRAVGVRWVEDHYEEVGA